MNVGKNVIGDGSNHDFKTNVTNEIQIWHCQLQKSIGSSCRLYYQENDQNYSFLGQAEQQQQQQRVSHSGQLYTAASELGI